MARTPIGYAFTKYAQVRDADESVAAANVRIEDGGYVVRDANGFAVAYVYGPSTEAEAIEAKQMSMDEARRVASNIAKLPDMLNRGE